MSLFYTGKGDKGSSHIGKKKYPKDHPVLVVLGELDELNSFIGLTRSLLKDKKLVLKLENVQQDLFIIQAKTAWFLFPKFKAPEFSEQKIKVMEKEIAGMEKRIRPERAFVLPGANVASSWLHVLRSVARRTERNMFSLSRLNGGQAKKYKVPPEILTYLNRLSSYLYALARMEAFKKNIKEKKPTYR